MCPWLGIRRPYGHLGFEEAWNIKRPDFIIVKPGTTLSSLNTGVPQMLKKPARNVAATRALHGEPFKVALEQVQSIVGNGDHERRATTRNELAIAAVTYRAAK